MSDELYLIAHKVRGEPAFDVATRMSCPHCDDQSGTPLGCHECDSLGYWWIIPTSGHRAYPSDYYELKGCLDGCGDRVIDHLALPTDAHQDHYPTRAAPTISLTEALGLKAPPPPPILRRM